MNARHLFACLASALIVCQAACASQSEATLEPHLSDEAFWALSTRLSEPPGTFAHSENLVSNEPGLAHTVKFLRPSGGVYIGVGPEQNFSYIARLQPAMAFIIDIRRENLNLHLLYKALFDLAIDRADFVSRLFSRERPPGLAGDATVHEIFTAYAAARHSDQLFATNLRLIREQLLEKHRLPLSPEDLQWIEYSLAAFHADGPDIHYGRLLPPTAAGPSYRTLMTATDVWGEARSYLASEEDFAVVKDLHAKNLIVPVVGDFGGGGVIRRTGEYIRQQGSVVGAFYGSNVEVYLSKQQMASFCGALASLPWTADTWFIAGTMPRPLSSKIERCTPPTSAQPEGGAAQ